MSFLFKVNLFKTSFLLLTSSIFFSTFSLFAQNNSSLFNVSQEFENKLTTQALLQSTRYYARGHNFKVGQKWLTSELITTFKALNFRQRASEQALLPGDFTVFQAQECSNFFSLSLMRESKCFHWINPSNNLKDKTESSGFIIVELDGVIQQIFKTEPLEVISVASTEPVLVAQFRNNEPIVQIETKLSDYPVHCLNAIIAIEDNDFLDHSGVSITGLARAVLKNILSLRKAQGGSTITQQLVKNYFLTSEKTYTRKLKELYMAIRLESTWSKDQILETYLNVIYMGQNGGFQVHGFGAASDYYFGKSIKNLNLSECALLSAIVNNPGLNNPWRKPGKARSRRHLVLSKMKDLKLISDSELKQADSLPLPKTQKQLATETAPYFFEAVRQQAQQLNIPILGTSFYTSLDLAQQEAAQNALQSGITNLTQIKKGLKQKKELGIELQGVVLSAENNSGLITTFVGGQNFKKSQFNRALYSQRQIGSLMKPFVFLAGLQKNYTPLSIIDDSAFTWKFEKKSWTPQNYDKKFRGPVPYYYALKESLNAPTARIADSVGLDSIIKLCHLVGLTSKIENYPSSSLGASLHTPLEVLKSYQALALLGKKQNLSFFEKATNDSGEIYYSHETKTEKIIEATEVSLLVGMMKETLINGTAKAVSASGFNQPAAGKTGTTSDGRDAWFAGFTPATTSVVWLGFDQNLPTSLTGGSSAVPIWIEFMKKTQHHELENDFSWPEDVEVKEVESEIDQRKIKLVLKKENFFF